MRTITVFAGRLMFGTIYIDVSTRPVEIATEREEMAERDSTNVSSFAINGHSTVASDGPKDSASQVADGSSLSPTRIAPGTAHSRDTSPIGGYLRHQAPQNRPRVGPNQSRPLSLVELDSEIDALLDELANSCMDSTDGRRRSRSRCRSPRPLSQISFQPARDPNEPGPPPLSGYMKVCKPRKFGLKVFKRLFLAIDGLRLLVFKQRTAGGGGGGGAIGTGTGTGEEDMTLGSRLRRRASLLSLTSLSPFGHAFGLQSPGPGASNGLCGTSAAVLGLVSELVIRFSDVNTYTDWLALLRIATAIPFVGLSPLDDQMDGLPGVSDGLAQQLLTQSTYEAERKAISGLVRLIAPGSGRSADSTDSGADTSTLHFVGLHSRLEKRLADFLPMRVGLIKGMPKPLEIRRDQMDTTTTTTGTLSPDSRPPLHPSTGSSLISQKASFVRRICLAYSRIQQLTSTQAKLKYISAWEQMPNHGIAFFPARIEVTLPLASLFPPDNNTDPSGTGANTGAGAGGGRNTVPWMNRPAGGGHITVSSSRRIEAVGIGPTRIFRCDLNTGDIMASWRLSSIQGWHINWELGELVLLLASPGAKRAQMQSREHETRSGSPPPAPQSLSTNTCAGRVIIRPVDVSVRILAEFLGGYAFLNLRSPEKNQGLDEGVFYKLTTGSALPMTHTPVHGITYG
ncbi:unnamed protein product [Echinostoma caproni]|uniref:FERM_M domain-containing protein n=1 Tax=Echinostoma caproni TaxID=27848 RepID=A0A183AKF5_9TREM|nr:unnamed protein product [Echinostoma caproni]